MYITPRSQNSVAHMMNAMNKVLHDCIPEIMMPFSDDILVMGFHMEERDETVDDRGCLDLIANHIFDCAKVLQKLENAGLTLFGE